MRGRIAVIASLLAACAGSNVQQSAQDAGQLGSVAPGADAGTADNGADAGTMIACSLADAGPVWTIKNDVDPYGNGLFYNGAGSDSAGGVWVSWAANGGHSSSSGWIGVDRDGVPRTSHFDGADYQPSSGNTWHAWTVAGGLVFGGAGAIFDATDGGARAGWDGALPPEADAGTYHWEFALAADGNRSVFGLTDIWAGTEVHTLLTEIDSSGHTVWQRAFDDGFPQGIALDESGTTQLAFHDVTIGLDADGRTLYTAPWNDPQGGVPFAAGGGHVYRGDRTLLDAVDGSPSLTLPFEPDGSAVLTATRILVREADGMHTGKLAAVSPSTGAVLWERPIANDPSYALAISGAYVLVIDPANALHFVRQDGADALVCQLPEHSSPGVLLPGGRLVIAHDGDLSAYDLPLDLEP